MRFHFWFRIHNGHQCRRCALIRKRLKREFGYYRDGVRVPRPDCVS
jgi:hypothetical protein